MHVRHRRRLADAIVLHSLLAFSNDRITFALFLLLITMLPAHTVPGHLASQARGYLLHSDEAIFL